MAIGEDKRESVKMGGFKQKKADEFVLHFDYTTSKMFNFYLAFFV